MKVLQEPGYVLHTYNYRESSLIVEIFSHHYGRVSLIAKGARKWKKNGVNTYLRPFQKFNFSWIGRGELGTLTGVEETPPPVTLSKDSLYCGFYVNELLIGLLHRFDPHERLFEQYELCLIELASATELESSLRLFEKRMLLELGYGLNLTSEVSSGLPVDETKQYQYTPNEGPSLASGDGPSLHQCSISGKSLIAFDQESINDPDILQELKYLMRSLIDHQLNYKPLVSRKMFNVGFRQEPADGSNKIWNR